MPNETMPGIGEPQIQPPKREKSRVGNSILLTALALLLLYPLSYGPVFGFFFRKQFTMTAPEITRISNIMAVAYTPLWNVMVLVPGGAEFLYHYMLLCCRHLYQIPESQLRLLPGYVPPTTPSISAAPTTSPPSSSPGSGSGSLP
ncbi:MAG TPA: hypothetical protein VK970_22225 [Candidatus Methylacidiphilales bacterium]|nr:hypothetical protein [Candidatus Methylacidiphilales bacterium]